MERDALAKRFQAELLHRYGVAQRECGYNAARYLEMIRDHGGEGAAHRLLGGQSLHSEGLDRLSALDRLELSLEASALREEFVPLFTATELETARARLLAYGVSDVEALLRR